MRVSVGHWRRGLAVCVASALCLAGAPRAAQVQAPPGFAALVARLSEPGGYFDTDDLVSNERSYQHVVAALRQAGFQGGAYIGVGPDQNFTYIAQIRPSIAFILDIRRDNLLLHLLFKALFTQSSTRADYLSLLFGRPPPANLADWRQAGVERIFDYLDRTAPAAPSATTQARLDATLKGFGVPLSAEDLETIHRFHRTFITAGTALRLEILGRGTPGYYPTYRDLALETDREGHERCYLASEDDFQFVRSLEAHDLVVPVVGNLAGPAALRNIGKYMSERGDRLAAFYTSNVEFYLFRDGSFPQFVENLSHVPHASRSLIIRSVFAGAAGGAVPMLPGYASASIVGGVDAMLQGVAAGRIRSYWELVSAR